MKKDTFLRGAFIATLCIVLTKILGVLYVIPFYSIVGSSGSVIYGAAYNIYAIFLNLSTVGLPLAISKMVSEYHTLGYEHTKRRTYKLAGRVMIITSLITTALLLIFAPFLAKYIINFNDYSNLSYVLGNVAQAQANLMYGEYLIREIAFVIRISATAIFFVTLISMIRGYLQGMKYIQPSSISQVIEQFIRVVVILVGSYLCVYVFKTSLGISVGVAVSGATMGAIGAYIYLRHKKKQIPEDFETIKEEEKEITNKDLIKKIIMYTIPLIIMELIGTSFQLVDMFTVVKTLTDVGGFSLTDASFIMNAVTTLGTKLNVIVTAIANGLVVSLLPSLASDYVAGNMDEIKHKINKTLQILIYITVPMAVGLSLLSEPVWTIFYGQSYYGPKVFMVSIFVAIFSSLFTNVVVTMQSLSRYKKLYIALFTGFIFNVIMNIPFMVIFHKIGLPIYYGNLVATMIGYGITIAICLIDLKKQFQVNYTETFKRWIYIIISVVIMVGVLNVLNVFLPIAGHGRGMAVLITAIYALIGMVVYFGITYKLKLFQNIMGLEILKRFIKKREK